MHKLNDPRALAATEIIGLHVRNNSGEELGTIEDFVLDMETGRIAYAVMASGGVLGLGDKLFAVPFQSMALDLDHSEFVLDADREKLEKAPGFEKDHWPHMGHREWGSTIHAFYNQTPYWELTEPPHGP